MRFSIIMPSYNQDHFIKRSIDSVLLQQKVADLELFVVDGQSTDDTCRILRQITDDRLHWTREPDDGQTHAVNKGLARMTGDIVGWLNSDDLYTPGALAKVAEAFEQHPKAQWIVGQCQIIDEQGRVIRRMITKYKNRKLRRYRYRTLLRENFINQPAVFWRRSFGEQIGLLNTSLHYTMDYDLWLRMGSKADPLILDDVLAQFRIHSASKTGAVNRKQFDEQYRVASEYFANDRTTRIIHRLNVEKIVWSYRLMKLLGL